MDRSRWGLLPQTFSAMASRRQSLVSLLPGVAMLLAAAEVTETAAKKRKKKKCKADANDCQTQTEPCIAVVTRKCDGVPEPNDPEQCKAEFLPCCDFLANCNSAAAMECLLQDV
jgi:hypothetical protein